MCLNCGQVIQSYYRHDYVTCSCGMCSIDGGTEYLSRVLKNDFLALDCTIYSDYPYIILRDYLYRLGHGKPGATDYGKFRVTIFSKMTNAHLEASLIYPTVTKGARHWQYLLEEKLYRIENEIFIPD